MARRKYKFEFVENANFQSCGEIESTRRFEVYGGIKMLTHVGTNTIETERLILRRFEYTDDDAMLKYWVADEKIQSFFNEFSRDKFCPRVEWNISSSV